MNTTSEKRADKFRIGLFHVRILLYTFIIFLAIAIFGYFTVDNHWIVIITNHLGGLSIFGLMAILTAYIAKRKGYSVLNTFNIAFFFPIILGMITVIIIYLRTGSIYCGGSVCLFVSFLIFITTIVLKTKQNL